MRSKIRAAGVIAALIVAGFGVTGVGAAMAADGGSAAIQSTPRGPYTTYNRCEDAGTAGEEDGSWPEESWHCARINDEWWVTDGSGTL